MGEESQSFPFARYQADHKSDEEISTMATLKKERTGKCFIYFFSGFVLLCVVALIFALIVLRVSSPSIELSSASLTMINLGHTNSSFSSSYDSFNFTLVAEIAVDNSNFGPFVFENCRVGLDYRGVIVGERNTGAGRVKAKGTKMINVNLEARSPLSSSLNLNNTSNGLSSSNITSDLNSGNLKVTSYGELRGEVHLIKLFKKRTVSEMNCSMTLNLNTRQFQDLVCR